jgi:hypothetical protein
MPDHDLVRVRVAVDEPARTDAFLAVTTPLGLDLDEAATRILLDGVRPGDAASAPRGIWAAERKLTSDDHAEPMRVFWLKWPTERHWRP